LSSFSPTSRGIISLHLDIKKGVHEVPVYGLEEFEKNLDSLSRSLTAVAGEHSIPFNEMFHPRFMARYTSFRSIEEMFSASGYKVESSKDFEAIPDAEWNRFVAEKTRFSTWDDMLGAAAKEWMASKIQF
ncbi:MAG: hypothetical protein PVG07_09105, partial [Acidobacteriota bacterium]